MALPAIAACTTPGRPGELADANALWLVGVWVVEGETCSGDAGLHYRGDGSWEAEDMAGRWRLRGNSLDLTVTRRAADMEKVPSRIAERIDILGTDRFIARRNDGSAQTFRRCRG